ncbi:hypothetical protein PI124_g12790 [Phytophthora idaei]|nr:hypothetical protein PI124_g12790 [Phytophthora idaei]
MLKAQLALFRDQYSDGKNEIDSVLFTATIWDTDSGDECTPHLALSLASTAIPA